MRTARKSVRRSARLIAAIVVSRPGNSNHGGRSTLQCALVNQRPPPPRLDLPLLSRWIEPLAPRGPGRSLLRVAVGLHLSLRDGAIGGLDVHPRERGFRAGAPGRPDRAPPRRAPTRRARARPCVASPGRSLPLSFPRTSKRAGHRPCRGPTIPPAGPRRFRASITRAFESRPHKVEIRRRQVTRLVVPAARPRTSTSGAGCRSTVTFSPTRAGAPVRAFNFHLPESDDGASKTSRAASRARRRRARTIAPTAESPTCMLDNGSAAFFFHEVLSHPMEADAPPRASPSLVEARLCPRKSRSSTNPRASTSSAAIPSTTRGSPRGAPLSSRRDIWRARSGTRLRADPPPPLDGKRAAPLSLRARGAAGFQSRGRAGRRERRGDAASSRHGYPDRGVRRGSVGPGLRPVPPPISGGPGRSPGRLGQPLGPATSKARSWKRWLAVDLASRIACEALPAARLVRSRRKDPPGRGEAPSVIVRRLRVSPR